MTVSSSYMSPSRTLVEKSPGHTPDGSTTVTEKNLVEVTGTFNSDTRCRGTKLRQVDSLAGTGVTAVEEQEENSSVMLWRFEGVEGAENFRFRDGPSP